MPRIPRTEASVPVRIENMPGLAGDGWTAPGRATQQLGQAIGQAGKAFGAAFEGMNEQQEAEHLHEAKLAALNLKNEWDLNEIETRATYTGDGKEYGAERAAAWQQRAAEYKSRYANSGPKVRRFTEMWTAQTSGGVLESTATFGRTRWHDTLYSDTGRALTGEIGSLASPEAAERFKADPAQFEAALAEKMAVTDGMINSLPLPQSRKDTLRNEAAAQFEATLDKLPASATIGTLRRKIEQFSQPAQPVPAGSPVGPVSNSNWRIFDKDTPTAAERNQIFKSGGVVVNLDTNWAPQGRATSPMVVIPDGATPEQRAAAETYAAGVTKIYNEKFGTNLKPVVKTRSENGRGRNATIHTEPYSVNDVRAVEYFNSDEGRRAHADLLRNTFGKVPGVAFSLPHDPTRKGDNGAVGPKGSEVDFARSLIAELKGASQIAANSPNPAAANSQEKPATEPAKPAGTGAEPQLVEGPREVSRGTTTEDKPVQVAEANTGNRVTTDAGPANRVPGEPMAPTSAYKGSVQNHLAERLLKKLPALERKYKAEVTGLIDGVADGAKKGYLPPEQELATVSRLVTETRDPELAEKLVSVIEQGKAAAAYRQASPVMVGQAAQLLRGRMAREGASAAMIAQVEGLEKLHKTMVSELERDPLNWAVQTGIVSPVPELTPQTFGVEMLRMRAETAQAIAQHYGPEFYQMFRPEEKERLKEMFGRGGKEMIAMAGMMVEGLGPDAMKAFKEISKDAPEAAHLGWMVANKADLQATKDLADAVLLKKSPDFKSRLPPDATIRTTADAMLGGALRAMPQSSGRIVEAANLLYEIRAHRKSLDPKTPDVELWKKGLREILGENVANGKTYGGLATEAGWFSPRQMKHPIVLPAHIRQDALPELIGAIRMGDLVQGGQTTGAPPEAMPDVARITDANKMLGYGDAGALQPIQTRGMPMDAQGRPMKLASLQKATLVTIGPGRYFLAMGDPNSDDPQYVRSADTEDQRFVLDLGALEPVLRQRVPDAFRAY